MVIWSLDPAKGLTAQLTCFSLDPAVVLAPPCPALQPERRLRACLCHCKLNRMHPPPHRTKRLETAQACARRAPGPKRIPTPPPPPPAALADPDRSPVSYNDSMTTGAFNRACSDPARPHPCHLNASLPLYEAGPRRPCPIQVPQCWLRDHTIASAYTTA